MNGTTKTTNQPTPDEALQKPKDGNASFVADKPTSNDISHDRRLALAKWQHP